LLSTIRRHSVRFAYPSAALALCVALFLAYPLLRGRPLELSLVAVLAASLAVQLAAVTRYVLHWRRPDIAKGVTLLIAIGSVADAVQWMRGYPIAHWDAAAPTGVLLWVCIGGLETWGVAAGWKRRSSSS
jgi:hypothetical protein